MPARARRRGRRWPAQPPLARRLRGPRLSHRPRMAPHMAHENHRAAVQRVRWGKAVVAWPGEGRSVTHRARRAAGIGETARRPEFGEVEVARVRGGTRGEQRGEVAGVLPRPSG